MTIEISRDRRVADVQKDFNSEFPYLRLEFLQPYTTPQKQDGTVARFANAASQMGDLYKNITDCFIDLPASITVNELERTFFTQLGLKARVLRKSGNIWMETSLTNNLTLQQQNEHGREISVLKIV